MTLGRNRIFWIAIAAGGVAVLLLLFLWALPARARLAEAEDRWRLQVKQMETLQARAAEIPSDSAVEKRGAYRNWLKQQTQLVESFFYDRTAVLTAPLAGADDAGVSPAQFKEAYVQAVLSQQGWLTKNNREMRVEVSPPYPNYPWMKGGGLPNPKDYPAILRAYWAHVHLYRCFLESSVKTVRQLKIGSTVYYNAEFDGMPMQAVLQLHPRDVTKLLRKVLTVSSSASGMPVMELKRVQVTPDGSPHTAGAEPMCSVVLEGYVLLVRKGKN